MKHNIRKTGSNHSNSVRTPRNKILVSAIVAALAMGAAGSVAAALPVSYALVGTLLPSGTQNLTVDNYLHSITNAQALGANVSTSISNSDLLYDGVGTGSPSTVNNNSIKASSTGNAALPNVNSSSLYGNTIDLGLLGTSGANSGLAILSGQVNSGHVVKASVAGSDIKTSLSNHQTGDVTNSNDTISANTQVNVASSHIDGELPTTTFTGSKPGSALPMLYAPPNYAVFGSSGDVVIGNAQFNGGNSTSGAVSNSNIAVTDATAGTVTANFSSTGNTISAAYGGNASDNGFDAQSGGAVSYHGSVTVGNLQMSQAANGAANISDSSISTAITGTNNFDGTLNESNNAIKATSLGNTTSNTLVFGTGINVTGNNLSASLRLGRSVNDTDAPTASGDLVLLNLQHNNNYSSGGIASLRKFSSAIAGSNIMGLGNAVATPGASMRVAGNQELADAGANVATNTLSADGASFDAGVAVGNQQTNYTTSSIASVNGAKVGAELADPNSISQGTVTVSGNSVGSSATGNQGATKVDLHADGSLDAGSGGITAVAAYHRTPEGGDYLLSGGAGVSVGNMQRQETYSAATATTSGVWLGAYYADSIKAGAGTVSGNSTGAYAGANQANTNVGLSGAYGRFTAALGSFQDSYGSGGSKATLNGDLTGIFIGNGYAAHAALDVEGNTMGARALGNNASNSLSTNFTSATLGGSWTGTNTMAANPSGNIDATANAALTLINDQSFNGRYGSGIAATVSNSQMGVDVGQHSGGDVRDASVTVIGNQAYASATANNTNNTLNPGIGTLGTPGNQAAQIATLSNAQVASQAVVSASVNPGATTTGAIYAEIHGDATGTPVTVSGNDVRAFASGNVAGNSMAVSGANFAPLGGSLNAGNGMSSFDTGTQIATASAAFTLQNMQTSNGYTNGGSRSATNMTSNGTAGASIWAYVLGDVTDSPLTISNNALGTVALDNNASNDLRLTGFFSTLDTTAALQNVQDSNASLTSGVTEPGIGAASGGDINGSALTVSGNQISALAYANSAVDTLVVQAGQLSGDSADLAGYPSLRGAVTSGANPTLVADYGLSSVQGRSGALAASVSGCVDCILVFGQSGDNFTGGSQAVTGNAITARAQANSASNDMALSGTHLTASGALLNQQTLAALSNATATIAVGGTGSSAFTAVVFGKLSGAPMTVGGNDAIAQAGLNDASNSLTVAATGSIDATGLSGSGASTDPATYAGYEGAVADYALYNTQAALSGASASIAPGYSNGVWVDETISDSSLNVSANDFTAQASANHASNSLSLTGASSISATTAIANVQTAGGGTIAASNTGANVSVLDFTGAAITNSPMTVSGNHITANASGNSASNDLENLPVALNAGSSESTQGSVGPLNASTALASNAVLNSQVNVDAISARVTNASIGVNVDPLGGNSPLIASVATVGNNVASAIASGNSAGNSIELSNLPTGVSSSALVSNQINSAAISASVTNTQIGVTAGATSTSPVTVTGNVISATAVGNSVSNSISVGH